jgi:DNA-binding LacI/PurR family transcriptional regulator
MATIHDVARKAGVAPSTVSYALSGKRKIAPETRERINRAIAELQFSPSVLGRRLASSRSNTIGIAFPVSAAELTWETLDFLPPVASMLNKRGFGLSIFAEPMLPDQLVQLYRENQVDGLILMQGLHQDPRIEALRDAGHPFLVLGRPANASGISVVDYDPEHAMMLILEHLAQLGHRHIGYLEYPPRKRKDRLAFSRFVQQGFARAQEQHGLTLIVEETDGSAESGHEAALNLLKRDTRITAFVTLPNATHIGVLRAMRQLGKRVPEDISLVGISRIHWSEWALPQLTSADIPLVDMVQNATELLLRKLDGEELHQQVIYPARLMLRESTARRRS